MSQSKEMETGMAKKIELKGTVQYFAGMDRPVNVSFDGVLVHDGQEARVISTHVEEILRHYVCTRRVGSASEREPVKITIEW